MLAVSDAAERPVHGLIELALRLAGGILPLEIGVLQTRHPIVLLNACDRVIVAPAEPFHSAHTGESWKHEKACFNLVGRFIDSLP